MKFSSSRWPDRHSPAYKYSLLTMLAVTASLLVYDITRTIRGQELAHLTGAAASHELLAAAACERNLSSLASELEAVKQEAERGIAGKAAELGAAKQMCEQKLAAKAAEVDAQGRAQPRCDQPWEKLFPKERVPAKCLEPGSDSEKEERRRSAKAERSVALDGIECGGPALEPSWVEWAVGNQRSFVVQRSQCEAAALLRSPLDHVTIMTIANNAKSWGRERSFRNFLGMVSNFTYPRNHTSVSVLVGDSAEYDYIKQVLESDFASLGYQSMKLFLRPLKLDIPRWQRRNAALQRDRRRLLARLRNWLLFNALEPTHDSVLWIDSDMTVIPRKMLRTFVDTQKDILVPLVKLIDGRGFEGNTWIGPRAKPGYEDRIKIATGGQFVPHNSRDAKFISHPDLKGKDFVEIDSVGGTILFVQADVHRQGVVFPTQYLVGGEWEFEGYDAIETEGICYLAQRLCFKCWGMPKIVARHDIS